MFAHGVGSRGDLPLPVWMFTWASAIALVISFFALAVLWTKPLLARASVGSELGAATLLGGIRAFGRAAALLLFGVALWAGLFGLDETNGNLLPVTLYVVVWVGAVVLGGLVGDVWRAINPLVTIAELIERLTGRAERMASPPAWLGHWPAVAGLAVFLFYELAHPSGSTPRNLGWMLLAHTVVSLGFAWRWGSTWLADNEPFSVLFAAVGAMAPIGRDENGSLRRRPLVSGLATMTVVPGTLGVLLVVLGGTSFDGFSESEIGRDVFGRPTGWGGAFTLTIGLIVSILLLTALYYAAIGWTKRVTGVPIPSLASSFAPSLVPIVFGYAVAHYAQLLVDEIQSFVFRLSDPGGLGWDLFGGADGTIDFTLISPDAVAWVQVLAILVGHVGAVVVAHDRSLELFSEAESLRSQFAMLLVMVAYSTLGLLLLLNA